MHPRVVSSRRFTFRPVTAEGLDDLRRFSADHGRFGYCSCMRWRLASSVFARLKPPERGRALERLLEDAVAIGVLAYEDDKGDEPVGWCSIAPRTTYAAVERSKKITRTDQEGVWSIVCFFLDRRVRGIGLPSQLLDAAIRYARDEGARAVEAYPWPGGPSYRYMGTRELYASKGFEHIPVPEGMRPVMQLRPP